MFDAEYVKKIKLFIFKAAHFLLTVILFYFTFLIFRYNEFPLVKDVGFRYNYFVTGGFILALLFFNHTYNSHLFGYSRIRTLVFAQFLSQMFSTAIVYLSVSLAWNHIESPAVFFLFLLLCFCKIVCQLV